eukprot:SAG31_NODE_3117_length_4657_cov_12.864634_1_plen_39_part_00
MRQVLNLAYLIVFVHFFKKNITAVSESYEASAVEPATF